MGQKLKKILTPDSQQIDSRRFKWTDSAKDAAHLFSEAGLGDRPKRRRGAYGARRKRRVRLYVPIRSRGWHNRLPIPACSAPADGGAAVTPRGAASHHRLHVDDLRRRRGASARTPPPGRARGAVTTIEAAADYVAVSSMLDRTGRDGKPLVARTSEALERALLPWAMGARPAHPDRRRRRRHHRGLSGTNRTLQGRHILDALGLSQPLTIVRRRGRHHGNRAARTARPPSPRCARCDIRPVWSPSCSPEGGDALANWRSTTGGFAVTLSAIATGFVVLCPLLRLPLAGDARARSRPDPRHRAQPCIGIPRSTAGRCRPVGLGPGARPGVLVAFDVRHPSASSAERRSAHLRREVNALVHKDDINLYQDRHPGGRRQGGSRSITRARMRHADGRWLRSRARCELARQTPAAQARPAPDRHRRRHYRAGRTWSSGPWRRTLRLHRLRDAIETIPEEFAPWDADTVSCCAIRPFRSSITRPDGGRRRNGPGCGTGTVAGCLILRSTVATTMHSPARVPSKLQLDDGRWTLLHQRAAVQGRRLRLGRHGYHNKTARAEAGRGREAADRRHRRPAQIAKASCRARPRSLPTSPKNTPRQKLAPRKPISPTRNSRPI